MDKKSLSWIEIDRKAIRNNIRTLTSLAGPKVAVAAAVKANGYGHGLSEMVAILGKTDVPCLALHSTAEAETARAAGWERKIMMVGGIAPEDIDWSPQIIASNPAPGEEVALDSPIALRFDQPMDQDSVEAAWAIEPATDGRPLPEPDPAGAGAPA